MTNESAVPRRSPNAALKRMLFEEAGYRCAIPTCRSTSVLEMAHIKPWRDERVNEFENLICLCRNCHGLYDIEKKIPENSIRVYKANLAVLNGRYCDFERRMFDQWQEQGRDTPICLEVSGSTILNTRNIVRDGLAYVQPTPGRQSTILMPNGARMTQLAVAFSGPNSASLRTMNPAGGQRIAGHDDYCLTPEGHQFMDRLFNAEAI